MNQDHDVQRQIQQLQEQVRSSVAQIAELQGQIQSQGRRLNPASCHDFAVPTSPHAPHFASAATQATGLTVVNGPWDLPTDAQKPLDVHHGLAHSQQQRLSVPMTLVRLTLGISHRMHRLTLVGSPGLAWTTLALPRYISVRCRNSTCHRSRIGWIEGRICRRLPKDLSRSRSPSPLPLRPWVDFVHRRRTYRIHGESIQPSIPHPISQCAGPSRSVWANTMLPPPCPLSRSR
jgi:hypothetical protein